MPLLEVRVEGAVLGLNSVSALLTLGVNGRVIKAVNVTVKSQGGLVNKHANLLRLLAKPRFLIMHARDAGAILSYVPRRACGIRRGLNGRRRGALRSEGNVSLANLNMGKEALSILITGGAKASSNRG